LAASAADGRIVRKTQRAEVRFDDISGCLRTPAGGSSRQTVLIVEGKQVRSRLLSPREAARLMGVPDDYPLTSVNLYFSEPSCRAGAALLVAKIIGDYLD
jgi:DNA (cytosine-5)-methyltransferase 1